MSNTIEAVTFPVMESFYTIQGEGAFSGRAAYFIRLGGCDVGCVWCDVKESWPIQGHQIKTIGVIEEEYQKSPSDIVVVTGGEPLMYDCKPLTDSIAKVGKRSHIETSGAHPLSGEWDWICLSPKKFKLPMPDICEVANELKVIVYNKSDFDWAEKYADKVKDHCELYLQPEFSKESEILPLIIDYVKSNPKWRISLQTHKIINVP